MKKVLLTTACLLAVPLAAQAGGLEKSGQPVTLLFEKGDLVQAELAYGIPTVTGVDSFGNGSFKTISPVWALNLIPSAFWLRAA